MNIRELQKSVHALAVSKGWYEGVPDAFDTTWIAARLALVHSEVSEALECVRAGETQLSLRGSAGEQTVDELGVAAAARLLAVGCKPVGLPSELADIVIRVLGLAESLGIDMQAAVEMKHAFNTTRPHRHGGKAL